MIVVDAGPVVEFLLRGPREATLADALGARRVLAAPALIDFEVFAVLRRIVLGGQVAADRASLALTALIRLPMVRYPMPDLLAEAWRLRANFAAADAIYVALAQQLGVSLLTLDERLGRAVQAHTTVSLERWSSGGA